MQVDQNLIMMMMTMTLVIHHQLLGNDTDVDVNNTVHVMDLYMVELYTIQQRVPTVCGIHKQSRGINDVDKCKY